MGVSESVEEYLEALWISEEGGEKLAHIKWVANHLGVAVPSALERLKKLERKGFVLYEARKIDPEGQMLPMTRHNNDLNIDST